MRAISLPGFGRPTSQLGYGCAFWPGTTEAQAHRLLHAAYDAGIRHFDVAPFYLDGRAEAYLGSFLVGRDDATVTTKYGLLPPSARPLHIQMARLLLGPAVRAVRSRRRAPGAPDSGGLTAKASYRPEQVRTSLARSLRLLRRSQVDLFLMHEPEVADLAVLGLLERVRTEKSAGRIGAFGVGGDVSRVSAAHRAQPEFCQITQFNRDAIRGGPNFPGAFEIHFWVLTRDFGALVAHFAEHADAAGRLAEKIGLDVTDARVLARLMLKAALLENSDGLTLIYSSDPKHIADNADVVDDGALTEPARRLIEAARDATLAGLARPDAASAAS